MSTTYTDVASQVILGKLGCSAGGRDYLGIQTYQLRIKYPLMPSFSCLLIQTGYQKYLRGRFLCTPGEIDAHGPDLRLHSRAEGFEDPYLLKDDKCCIHVGFRDSFIPRQELSAAGRKWSGRVPNWHRDEARFSTQLTR